MPFAVVFYLDEKRADPIRQITRELARQGVAPYLHESGIPPHITLAIYEQLNCQPCEEKIAQLAGQTHGFDLTFSFLGIFQTDNPVVFTAPTVTQELLNYHREIHALLKDDAVDAWHLYEPGIWVPHCSLAVDFKADMLVPAVQICRTLQLPLTIPVESLGVVQFEPIARMYTYPFQRKTRTTLDQ